MLHMVHNPWYCSTDAVRLNDTIDGWKGKESTVAPRKKEIERKKRYRCNRCGYIVYAEAGKTKKAPRFCPQCAVVHYKGDMVPLSE